MGDGLLLPSNLITTPKHKIAKKSLPFAINLWLTDKIFFIQKRLTPKRKRKKISPRLHLLLFRPSLMSLIRYQYFSASPIYPDFTAASFFVFIFRALRPCDQDSPISEWKPVYLFRACVSGGWRVRKGDSLLIHSFIRKENTPFCREKHLKIPDYLCGWLKLKKPFCFLFIILLKPNICVTSPLTCLNFHVFCRKYTTGSPSSGYE